MPVTTPETDASSDLFAVDIGSTVLKLARVTPDGALTHQEFHDRDYNVEIVDQLDRLLSPYAKIFNNDNLVICSSANGGLRVGIVCVSKSYSGTIFRNQVLLGGANPVFVHEINNYRPDDQYVDILLVGGGIDCEDTGATILNTEISLDIYNYGTLVYAGNQFLADSFVRRFPDAKIIANPMANSLNNTSDSIFAALRDAYLDDLVYKHGVSEVAAKFDCGIFPTPEVVSSGYYKAISERLFPEISSASILMDIGGATTDFHYALELVRDDSVNRPAAGASVARYVFTDLGVFASRESTVLRLRRNPRTFEFLETVLDADVNEVYRLLREGDYDLQPELLSYACIFLGLDRFSRGDGPGLPTADLTRLNKLVLTGGAAQMLNEHRVAAIVSLFLSTPVDATFVMIDNRYEIWVQGAISHQRKIGFCP